MNRSCCLLLIVASLAGATSFHTDGEPVPDSAAQAKAEKEIRDLFKDDYARKKPSDQIDLARKLLKVADDTPGTTAEKFVLLREARDLAARGGDLELSLQIAEATVKMYAVNPIEFKTAVLNVAETSQSTSARDVAEVGLTIVEEATRVDDYAAAEKLLELAGRAAGRAKVPGLNDLVSVRAKEIESLHKSFDATAPDRLTLKLKSDDTAAAGRVGRFLALAKGDWEAGLPLLAISNDARLKSAAEKDLVKPTAAAGQLAVADAWWDLADSLDPMEKTEARLRAHFWYSQAVVGLSGLTKTRVEKRLDESAKLAEQKLGRTAIGGWIVLFRAADPALWNTATNRGRTQFAIPLKSAPAGVKYLRLTELGKGNAVIVEMSNDRLGERTELNGYGWVGTKQDEYQALHLGIYDTTWKDIPKGSICLFHPGGFDGFRGWGFGHRSFMDDQQGYSWAGMPTPATPFEIAVKVGSLTPDESRKLLNRKKK